MSTPIIVWLHVFGSTFNGHKGENYLNSSSILFSENYPELSNLCTKWLFFLLWHHPTMSSISLVHFFSWRGLIWPSFQHWFTFILIWLNKTFVPTLVHFYSNLAWYHFYSLYNQPWLDFLERFFSILLNQFVIYSWMHFTYILTFNQLVMSTPILIWLHIFGSTLKGHKVEN